MAVLVTLSRVVLGVHFPSDILAGMVVGCASAWLVAHLAPRVWPGSAHGGAHGDGTGAPPQLHA